MRLMHEYQRLHLIEKLIHHYFQLAFFELIIYIIHSHHAFLHALLHFLISLAKEY